MNSPTSASPQRSRPDPRAFVIASIAGVVTLALVIGLGIVLGRTNFSLPNASNTMPYPVLDEAWANGTTQKWTTTIDPDSLVMGAGNHLIAVGQYGTANTTLTAYTLGSKAPEQAWTATADTSADTTVGGDQNPAPAFLRWGERTLVHDTTLYDLETGATSQAPWPAGSSLVVAGDVAIACATDNTCSGYKEGESVVAWTTSLLDATNTIILDPPRELNVLQRGNSRYAIVGYHAVVDIDTGRTLSFDLPVETNEGWAVGSARDGWAVRLPVKNAEPGTVKIITYGLDGGSSVAQYDGNPPWRYPDQSWLLRLREMRSLDDFVKVWVEQDTSSIPGVVTYDSQATCVLSVQPTSGQNITMPNINGGQGMNSCIKDVFSSRRGEVIIASTVDAVNSYSFNVMFNASSGQQIAFEGMDPKNGAVFLLADRKTIIGYSPRDGSLIGYAPAD